MRGDRRQSFRSVRWRRNLILTPGFPDHLIFDLDGTLVDSVAVCAAILNEMLEERGADHALSHDDCRGYMSAGGRDMVVGLLGARCLSPDSDLQDFRARYAARPTPSDCLFPDVADGLRELASAGFTLSICSNKPQLLCEKVIGDLGLSDIFSVIVGGRPSCPPKPHPGLVNLVVAELDTTAARCLFVGDSELDHASAAAANMDFLFVTYGYAAPGWTPGHATCFDHFHALVAHLLERAPLLRSSTHVSAG